MRKFIPVMLIGASLCSSFYPIFAYSAKSDNSNSTVWEDPNSKSWGATPPGVKTALSRVKVLGGSEVNIFNVQWLKEMARSPSMYHLSEGDIKWANQVIKDSDAKNKKVWSPNGKVIIQEPVAAKKPEIAKVSQTAVKQEDKSVKVKAESKPLPNPVFVAENKNPDLSPVEVKPRLKEKPFVKPDVVKKEQTLIKEVKKVEPKYKNVSDETINKVLLSALQLSNDIKIIQKNEKNTAQQKIVLNNLPVIKYVDVKTNEFSQIVIKNTPKVKFTQKPLEVIKSQKPEVVVLSNIPPVKHENSINNGEDKNTKWMSSALSTISLISGIIFLSLFMFYRNTSQNNRKKYF